MSPLEMAIIAALRDGGAMTDTELWTATADARSSSRPSSMVAIFVATANLEESGCIEIAPRTLRIWQLTEKGLAAAGEAQEVPLGSF